MHNIPITLQWWLINIQTVSFCFIMCLLHCGKEFCWKLWPGQEEWVTCQPWSKMSFIVKWIHIELSKIEHSMSIPHFSLQSYVKTWVILIPHFSLQSYVKTWVILTMILEHWKSADKHTNISTSKFQCRIEINIFKILMFDVDNRRYFNTFYWTSTKCWKINVKISTSIQKINCAHWVHIDCWKYLRHLTHSPWSGHY